MPQFMEVVVVEAVFECKCNAFVVNRCCSLLTDKARAIAMFPKQTDLTTLKRIKSVHYHKFYNAMCIYIVLERIQDDRFRPRAVGRGG